MRVSVARLIQITMTFQEATEIHMSQETIKDIGTRTKQGWTGQDFNGVPVTIDDSLAFGEVVIRGSVAVPNA